MPISHPGGWGQGYSPALCAAGSGCAESAAFLARVAAQDATHTAAYQALICGLVTDGIWSKLDALYMLKANESATALTNLKSSSYNLTNNGATFSANAYYAGNGSTAYLETGFNPSTAGGNFSRNSGMIAGWSTLASQDTGTVIGQSTASGCSQIWPRYTDNKVYARLNQAADDSTANTNGDGLFVLSRTGSTAIRLERNGSLIASYTTASVAPVSSTFSILAGGDYFDGRCSAAAIGGGLTSTEMGNLYTRINTYMGAF